MPFRLGMEHTSKGDEVLLHKDASPCSYQHLGQGKKALGC